MKRPSKPARLQVPIKDAYVDYHMFCGTPDGVISRMQELKKEHGAEVSLTLRLDYEPYSNGEQRIDVALYRPETDEEYQTRLEKEKELEQAREKAQFDQYLSLKKKYEK